MSAARAASESEIMPFELVRQPLELVRRRVRVASTEWVTPAYRRLVFEGDELRGFHSPGADDHLRIFFDDETSREYTPVAWDAEAGSLTLDFVIHSDGVATRWAAEAEPGDEVVIGGPRGALVLEGSPDWWLLAGDETALPAIRRHLAAVAPGIPVKVIVSIGDRSAEQPLESAGDLQVSWVPTPDDAPAGSVGALVDALATTPAYLGTESADGFAFVAAEQSIVKPARDVLFTEWGLDTARAVIKGYWKRGESEYHAPH